MFLRGSLQKRKKRIMGERGKKSIQGKEERPQREEGE